MTIRFPDDFLWGITTSAAQIETASDHQFRGLQARDGYLFTRTTDHERKRIADVDIISRFGSVYRCSLDWARLQREPYAAFDKLVVAEYRDFFEALQGRGVKIMLVLHHFAHPLWFERDGGWIWESNLKVFYDFATRCIEAFGDLVYAWNTFNDPNLFALNAYYRALWPPFESSLTKATRVAGHMAQGHQQVYRRIKERFPSAEVGYSINTAYVEGRGIRAQASAQLFDWWFYTRTVKLFSPIDFIGIHYLAYVPFAPQALNAVEHADRLETLGLPHDKLWALKPEGLSFQIQRAHKDTGKPVWVSTGVCTDDEQLRIDTLQRYLATVHASLRSRIPIRGFLHYGAWDSFEWEMGPSYGYGLMKLDLANFERIDTDAAQWYERSAESNEIELP